MRVACDYFDFHRWKLLARGRGNGRRRGWVGSGGRRSCGRNWRSGRFRYDVGFLLGFGFFLNYRCWSRGRGWGRGGSGYGVHYRGGRGGRRRSLRPRRLNRRCVGICNFIRAKPEIPVPHQNHDQRHYQERQCENQSASVSSFHFRSRLRNLSWSNYRAVTRCPSYLRKKMARPARSMARKGDGQIDPPKPASQESAARWPCSFLRSRFSG